MPLVDPWNNATPAGGDNPQEGDDRIREVKRAAEERLRRGDHYWPSGASIDNDSGKHECGVDPDGNTGEFIVVESNGHAGNRTTPAVRVWDGAAASPDQVVFGEGRAGGAGRQYTLDTYTVNAQNIDANGTLDVAGTATLTGLLDTQGQIKHKSQTTGSTPVTVAATDQVILLTSTGNMTLNLPPAANFVNRFLHIIRTVAAAGTPTITLDPDGAELINGAAAVALASTAGERKAAIIFCDGSAWYLVVDNNF